MIVCPLLILQIEYFTKQIKYSSICKLHKYNQIFLDSIRETKEHVVGHGLLTLSALTIMGACCFV